MRGVRQYSRRAEVDGGFQLQEGPILGGGPEVSGLLRGGWE